MLTVLYREHKYEYASHYDPDEPSDAVKVTLRKWRGESSCDVVREEFVTVDSQVVLNQRICADGHSHTDAEFQRQAIARFDELMANHPVLGPSFRGAA